MGRQFSAAVLFLRCSWDDELVWHAHINKSTVSYINEHCDYYGGYSLWGLADGSSDVSLCRTYIARDPLYSPLPSYLASYNTCCQMTP